MSETETEDAGAFDASELAELEQQERALAARREALMQKVTPEQKQLMRKLEVAKQGIDDAIQAYDDLAAALRMKSYRESMAKVAATKVAATREASPPPVLTEEELGQLLGVLLPENEGPGMTPRQAADVLGWPNGGRKALHGLAQLKKEKRIVGDNGASYRQCYSLPARAPEAAKAAKPPAKKR